MFRDAPRYALEALVSRMRTVTLQTNELLFQEDDPPAFVFVVVQGQLQPVRPSAEGERPFGPLLGPGSVIGEIAVVRGENRSVSVRARSASELMAIPAVDFMRLLRQVPSVALAVARTVADRFAALDEKRDLPDAPWVVLAGAYTDPTFVVQLANALACRLRASLTLWGLASPPLDVRLDPRIRLAPAGASAADAAARTADSGGRLLAFGHADALRPLLPSADGVVFSRTQRSWLADGARPRQALALCPDGPATRSRIIVGRDRRDVVEQVVRRLLGRSLGLALGGGAALGLAHLGVLGALRDLRVPIDVVAGTSAGALFGGFHLAVGHDVTVSAARTVDSTWKLLSLLDPGYFITGQLKGDRLLQFLRRYLKETRIEDLPVPFGAKVLNLATGEDRLLTRGRLADVIRASVALAGVFAPAYLRGPGGEEMGPFIDAGGVDNVPVEATRELGADRVLGVHVVARPDPEANFDRTLPASQARTVLQAQLLSFARNGERQVFTADVAVIPDTRRFGFTDFRRLDELMLAGRRATYEIADRLRMLDPWTSPAVSPDGF
jgi:NTE family protein